MYRFSDPAGVHARRVRLRDDLVPPARGMDGVGGGGGGRGRRGFGGRAADDDQQQAARAEKKGED